MKCYNHTDLDAVGICKACNKGICRECAVDLGNGLACRDSCEQEVREVNEIIVRSKTIHKKTGQFYGGGAIIAGLIGLLFLLFGLVILLFGDEKGLARISHHFS